MGAPPDSPLTPPRLRPTRPGGRWIVAGVVGLVVAVGATTAVVATSGEPAPVETASTRAQQAPAPGLDAETRARLDELLGRDAAPQPVVTGPSAPRRLLVPSLGIDARVVGVAAPGRALLPPSDPDLLGWWSEGAAPGAAVGSALITGHSVHTGGGALQDIGDLRRGAEVVVETEAGPIRYTVGSIDVLDKPALAREAPDLFSQEAEGRLVLITCEDWNGVEWLSNTVVTAEPVARA